MCIITASSVSACPHEPRPPPELVALPGSRPVINEHYEQQREARLQMQSERLCEKAAPGLLGFTGVSSQLSAQAMTVALPAVGRAWGIG